MKPYLLLFSLMLGAVSPAPFATEAPAKTQDNGYVEPFQILDNLYYVGDQWVSAYVIATTQGLILIDTMDFPYSLWLPANLDKLGLKLEHLKYIVITHGHSDHASGAGYLQKLTGAKVVMNKIDLPLLQAQAKEKHFLEASIDISPAEADSLRLGDTELNFYLTPGHTQGCTSIALMSADQGKPVKAFITCGNGTSFDGVDVTQRYIASVDKIREISLVEPKVSVNLPTHPHLGQIFERQRLRPKRDNNPFVDEKGFQQFIGLLQRRGHEKLLIEQNKKSH